MNIEDVLESIESGDSLNTAYKKAGRDRPWLLELLQRSYMRMGDKIKLHSTKDGYIAFQQAAFICDDLALTISAIYEEYISQLKREYKIAD